MTRLLAPALLLASWALADGLPAFKPGEWSYQREVNGAPLVRRKCADPTADLKRQHELLKRAGCAVTPLERAGPAYSFDATCSVKTAQGEVKSTTTSTITVQSESAYTVEVHGTANGKKTDETLTARRVGDCPK